MNDILVKQSAEPCGYFKERESTKFYTFYGMGENFDYNQDVTQYYSQLLHLGFRRCGSVFYTQHCKGCNQCTPIRLRAGDFVLSKSQRACLKRNADLSIVLNRDEKTFITDEKALLYREYDVYHNAGSVMSLESAKKCLETMNEGYSGVWNLEFRLGDRLVGVSVLDYTRDEQGRIDSLSSNYFYYDVSPEMKKRSLGVFSVLKEIEICQENHIPFYYLGLFLPDCRKMNYKTNYRPFELLQGGRWIPYEDIGEKKLNFNKVIELPMPGTIFFDDSVCFVTKDIPLEILYSAYMQGIFPWFNEDEGSPVLWQCPPERFVINIEEIHYPESLKKFLKKTPYSYTFDRCFDEVIKNCAKMYRPTQAGTWIGPMMIEAYCALHKTGLAHSVEVWREGRLVGGFYGVCIGRVFFGESMFTLESNSSKSAFAIFAEVFKACGGKLIDCQAYTDNMARYNAKNISRQDFLNMEKVLLHQSLKGDLRTAFENYVEQAGYGKN